MGNPNIRMRHSTQQYLFVGFEMGVPDTADHFNIGSLAWIKIT